MAQLYANNAFGTLSQPLAADGTSLVLQAGEGARFPLPSGGDFFLVTLAELNDVNNEVAWEIRRCTARVGDTLTVTQAQEGTASRAWVAGTRVDLRDTAGTLAGMAEKAALGTAAAKDVQTSLTDTTPGRLMLVGAFGLGTRSTAVDNLDCNTLDPDIRFIGVTNGNSINGPSWLQYYYIEQFSYVTGNRTQIAIPYKTSATDESAIGFRGYFEGSGWTPWQKVWDSANLDPASFATAAQGAKADTALQSETDPTVPAWAKAASKPSYTKSEVGLGNVDNTSDVNKPVSTAQQAALSSRVSGINVQTFTSSGTYTPSPGMLYAIAEGIGGGGGGGGANISSSAQIGLLCAGGGGGGAYAKSLIRASDVTGTFAVQIGAGGSGGVNTNGGSGGATTIIRSDGSNNYMFLGANGGGGGYRIVGGTSANGGSGGSLGTGSIVNSPGPKGGTGMLPDSGSTYIYPGNGADTRFGQGGRMAFNSWGTTGIGYGSGGGGQCVYLASTGQSASGNGGAGAPGLVIITEYLGG